MGRDGADERRETVRSELGVLEAVDEEAKELVRVLLSMRSEGRANLCERATSLSIAAEIGKDEACCSPLILLVMTEGLYAEVSGLKKECS